MNMNGSVCCRFLAISGGCNNQTWSQQVMLLVTEQVLQQYLLQQVIFQIIMIQHHCYDATFLMVYQMVQPATLLLLFNIYFVKIIGLQLVVVLCIITETQTVMDHFNLDQQNVASSWITVIGGGSMSQLKVNSIVPAGGSAKLVQRGGGIIQIVQTVNAQILSVVSWYND